MKDLLRERTASGNYFPEPTGPEPKFLLNTPNIEMIRFGRSIHHSLARAKINRWLVDWKFNNLNELIGRLESKLSSQHEGAVWELFLNSMFRSFGYKVERDSRSGSGEPPDFLVHTHLTKFYVEATCISSALKSTQEKNWVALVCAIETIERDDFFIDLNPTKLSNDVPKSSAFIREIKTFLDQFDYEASAEWTNENTPTKRIEIGNWEIDVRASRRSTRGNQGLFIRMRGSGRSALVTDLEDLTLKIQSKRKRYGKLKYPYVIAILENSFPLGNDNWHRYGALFGQEEVLISGDGSYKLNRKSGGVWEINKGKTDINSLLLLDRLNLWEGLHTLPELWTNPNLSNNWFHKILPFQYWRLKGEEYQKFRQPIYWTGVDRFRFLYRVFQVKP
jgi:hypothetical protein